MTERQRHSNPFDVADVSDCERAMMLLDYLTAFREEFGQLPKLMPLKESGKEPVIKGNCKLDTERGRSYLVGALEAVQRIRDCGATGFCIYAGKASHNTSNVVFVDHDDTEEFPAPTGEPTLEVLSGSGRGSHETYRNAGDVRNARVGDDWGEVRAENWYVVTPGSVHPSGGVYHVTEDREIETLSDDDLDDTMRPSTGSQTAAKAATRAGKPVPTVAYEPADDPSTTAEAVATREEWIGEYLRYGSDDRSKKDYAVCMKMAEYGVPESQVRKLLNSSPRTKVYHANGDYWERTWNNAVAEVERKGITNSKSVEESDAAKHVQELLDSQPVPDGGRANVADFRILNVVEALDDLGPARTGEITNHPVVNGDKSTVHRARRALQDLGVIEKEGDGPSTRYRLIVPD